MPGIAEDIPSVEESVVDESSPDDPVSASTTTSEPQPPATSTNIRE